MIGVLNPGGLLFTSLYAILVLLYLWERIRRRVEVPSLLLWQEVNEDLVQARKFRPDLLFLLQLLLLTGLIGGLARPYLAGAGSSGAPVRHIFLMDTSASMQAREGADTRFEQARAELMRRLGGLSPNDEVMLIAAAARPEVLSDFTRDRDLLRRLVAGLEATETGTDLELALAVAAGAQQRVDTASEIQVFSDLPADQLPPRWRELVASGQIDLVSVGETDHNLAITGLQIHQGRFQGASAVRASVVVQNFSHREGHGVLTVRLGEDRVMQTGFSIPARDVRSFLVPRFAGAGLVVASLDAGDALAADDVAFGWIRPLRVLRVLLVSADTPLAREMEAVARVTPGLQLTRLSPDAYDSPALAGIDVAVFHRFVPLAAPPAPALYIAPPPGNSLLPVAAEIGDVEVLDWNEQHEALGSLRPLAAMPIRRAQVILPGEERVPLLLARTPEREFALAFASEKHGLRSATIAFDLESEQLLRSDNVGFLLFLLNLLSWLAPDAHEVSTVATGSVVALSGLPPQPATVTDPKGRRIPLGGGRRATLEPFFVGEYRVRVDGVARTLYANFFDPDESDIGRAGRKGKAAAGGTAKSPERRAESRSAASGSEFGRWLLALAVGLFVLEWAVAMRET
jgi:hypothetical protein